ncbi:hypothetical protein ASF43_25035 [Pseudorhodoferax sp. Leaf267]|nr:hypothetical protein ASF43_25035 [Pseudorhodoferax sp. Leaf267]
MLRRRMLLLCCLGWGMARAQPKPTGDVVLTVGGRPGAGPRTAFDMKMLESLPQHSFTTHTPWYTEPVRFTGPLLRDVLAMAGIRGSKIVAVALNDYRTEIPFNDVTQHDVIVARLMNDKPMSVREKGPLFIVYPYDSKPELKAEIYYNRSAWQLNQLQVQ